VPAKRECCRCSNAKEVGIATANLTGQLDENHEGEAGASEGSRRVRSTRPSRMRWTCLKCRWSTAPWAARSPLRAARNMGLQRERSESAAHERSTRLRTGPKAPLCPIGRPSPQTTN